MTGPQCMGCGKPRDIPASTAITPCPDCGSTGIVTYWPPLTTAPVVTMGNIRVSSSGTPT